MTTLSAHIRQLSSKHAKSPVIEYHGSIITYFELDIISNHIATRLQDSYNVQPNDTVAIISENSPAFLCAAVGIWHLGAVVAPLNPMAPKDLLSSMLDLVEPKVILTSQSTYKAVLSSISSSTISTPSRCLSFEQLLGTSEETDSTIDDLKNMTMAPTATIVIGSTDLDLPCINLFTSSAVSKESLKCVPITHRTIIFDNQNTAKFLGIADKPQRELAWAPLTHYMGLCIGFLGHVLATGGCYVFGMSSIGNNTSGSSIPDQLIKTIKRLQGSDLQITIMSAVPWVIEVWRQDPTVLPTIQSLSSLLVSGAALSEEMLSWAKENNVNLINALGMSETGALFYSKRAPNLAIETICGYSVLPGKYAHLVSNDLDDDKIMDLMKNPQDCSPTDHGEMLISSRFILRGYRGLTSSDVYHNAETGISTFRTRDMYERLAHGIYKYIGRADDIAQLENGEKVNVIGVENILNQCVGVIRSCITGNNGPKVANHLIALIEVDSDDPIATAWSALKQANALFSTAARISFDKLRVFDARKNEHIPITRKQTIFRKMIWRDYIPKKDEPTTVAFNTPSSQVQSSRNDIYLKLERIVCQVFHVDKLEDDDTFESLGLTSILASNIVDLVKKNMGVELEASSPFIYSTVQALSDRICNKHSPTALRELNGKASRMHDEAVVFVSAACRFPGGINNLEQYWQALMGQWDKDCITSIPLQRWSNAALEAASGQALRSSKAGWLDDIEYFDNTFFNISNAEATSLNPNTRLALECTWEAFENAGIRPSSVRGQRIGVFIGVSSSSGFREVWLMNRGFGSYDHCFESGVSESSLSGRISHFLDIRGPSVTVQTACSSSLVAVQNGLQAIRNGECEMAIVGGVTTHLWPASFMYLSQAGLLSTKGRCSAFSDKADGFAPSEGACILLMMKEFEARAKGLNILGIAREATVMHNGYTPGLAAPSANAQLDLLSATISKTGIPSTSVGFLEAHGTGTIVGDQIEFEAINLVYADPSRRHPLLVGSSKTIIGHTEEAAGAAGVLKALLSFHNSILPPHPIEVSKKLNTQLVPVEFNTKAKNIADIEYASVSSFGFSGTIANVIIQRPSSNASGYANGDGVAARGYGILTISARSRDALSVQINAYLEALKGPSTSWIDFCYSSNVAREHFKHRVAICSPNLLEGVSKLRNFRALQPLSGGLIIQINPLRDFTVKPMDQPTYRFYYDRLVSIATNDKDWAVFCHLAAIYRLLEHIGRTRKPIYSQRDGAILAAYLCNALSLEAAHSLLHLCCDVDSNNVDKQTIDISVFEKWEDTNASGISTCGEGFYSSITGRILPPSTRLGAAYWFRHFTSESRALKEEVLNLDVPFEQLLANLYMHGTSIDWDKVHEAGGKIVALPNYQFDRKRFWPDVQDGGVMQLLTGMGFQK